MRSLFFIFMAFFVACSSGPTTVQTEFVSEKDLGIGESPTPPNEPILGEQSKALLSEKNAKKPRVGSNSNAQSIDKNASARIAIMSSSGGVLTLWALNPGNWVWGYPPLDVADFHQAPFWRIVSLSNGDVMIKNVEKNTCLQAYKNGVIHEACNNQLQTQRWNLNLFDNGAIQIQNVGAKTCLQTPTTRATRFYSIFLTQCAIGQPNLDQQWYAIPVIEDADPIFLIR